MTKEYFNFYSAPEEAAKVAFRRLTIFRNINVKEFFDLYNHFCNNAVLSTKRLSRLKTSDVEMYEEYKVNFLVLRYLEGCLRNLREMFYSSAGQTEIEGTNREFIRCVSLIELIGKLS